VFPDRVESLLSHAKMSVRTNKPVHGMNKFWDWLLKLHGLFDGAMRAPRPGELCAAPRVLRATAPASALTLLTR